jgi:hypothetical protein
LGLAVGGFVAVLENVQSTPEEAVAPGLRRVENENLRQPEPNLGPADVVRIQLTALSQEDRGAGVLQCFQFASPANRMVTGPLDRFFRLVTSPPYDVLCQSPSTVIGHPLIRGDYARILVTVAPIGSDDVRVFQFELSRQNQPPFEGCWMTDAVLEIRSRDVRRKTNAEVDAERS